MQKPSQSEKKKLNGFERELVSLQEMFEGSGIDGDVVALVWNENNRNYEATLQHLSEVQVS